MSDHGNILATLAAAQYGCRLREVEAKHPTMRREQVVAELWHLVEIGRATHSRMSERWSATGEGRAWLQRMESVRVDAEDAPA